jgi:TP901 family phage tail tape measure protein
VATETFIINVQTKGTVKAARDVRQIGAAASSSRKALALMRNALVAIASLRVFADLTSSLVDFSDQILVVSAVTGATEQQFQRLKATAQELGATTRFTAAEAAEGMAFLARAGFNVAETIGTIPGVLDLAAAAQLDLGRAADIASNLMTSFGLEVSDTTRIMDTLVFTANNSNTTVQQLADGLKLFAPIASQLGVDLEQASSAMAILGDAGIQASLAGTGVRRVLTDLEAPTGALANVLTNLGINFDEVRPSAVGLEGALLRLREANLGASAASVLFGKRGGFIFAELVRNVKNVGAFEEALRKAEGTAREAARELEKGIGGALRLVRSALQNLIITFGEIGGEAFLNQFFRDVAAALRAVAANAEQVAQAFKFLFTILAGKVILGLTVSLLKAAAATAVFTARTWAAARAAQGAAAFAKVWGAALLRIPFVAILTSLALLTAGLIGFSNEIQLTEDGTRNLNDVFVTLGDTLRDQATAALNGLGFEFEDFEAIVTTVSRRVGQAIEGIGAALAGLLAASPIIFRKMELLWKEFLLGLEFLVFSLQDSVNSLAQGVGLDDLFDTSDNVESMAELVRETQQLKAELETAPSVTEAFFGGGRDFLDRVQATADARRTAERDARILRSEEARRQAAGAGIEERGAESFLGRQVGDLAKSNKDTADSLKSLQDSLDGLVGSVFPLVDATNALSDAQEIVNEAVAAGAVLRVDEQELMDRVRRAHLGLGPTLDQVAEKQQVFNAALRDGIISLREFQELSRGNRLDFLEGQTDSFSGIERAFLKLEEQASNSAAFTEMVFTDAFKTLEDNFVSFIQEGTFELDSFFQNLSEQLLRLAAQQAITGAVGGIQGLLGGGTPTGGGAIGGGAASSGFGGILAGALFGAQNGAQFTVGAQSALGSLPGIDNRLIAFKAQDGEEVTVTPRGGGSGGTFNSPINIVQNIQARDADSFNRSEGQNAVRASSVLQRANRRR